tara:strand:- start:180 stop:896 length:717 start_codon:yes stop_codon:yes gene_type:complete
MSTVYAESTGSWNDMYGAEADNITATARNNTNYQFANATIINLLPQHGVIFSQTYIYRAFLSFDLSGESGTCTEAILSLRFRADVTSGFLTYTATPLYVCAVDTGESTFLTSGIWNDLDGWVSSGSYDGNVPNYGTMAKSGTSAETVTLTLNSDGLAAVNSAIGSGRFQIALLTDDDYLYNTSSGGLGSPSGGGFLGAIMGVNIASMQDTTVSNRPHLDLTLSAAAVTHNATFFGSNF